MKKYLALAGLALGLFLLPATADAHVYDRDDSDHPLRYVAYALHPIGIAIEYGVLRQIHWIVSQPDWDVIFGHEAYPEKEQDTYFEWK